MERGGGESLSSDLVYFLWRMRAGVILQLIQQCFADEKCKVFTLQPRCFIGPHKSEIIKVG